MISWEQSKAISACAKSRARSHKHGYLKLILERVHGVYKRDSHLRVRTLMLFM